MFIYMSSPPTNLLLTERLDMLLREYAENRTVENRNALVVGMLPEIVIMARSVRRMLPRHARLSADDLASHGVCGAICAIERYDPTRGVMLRTYVLHRVRGEMLDAIRETDDLSRSYRRVRPDFQVEQIEEKQHEKVSREPGPDQNATETELVNLLCSGFDEADEAIARGRIEGFAFPVIGQQIGLMGANVQYRYRSKVEPILRERLRHLLREGNE